MLSTLDVRKWDFNRLVVLLLTFAYVGLLFQVRIDHREVIYEKWQAWIPLVYSALMIPVCLLGLALWYRGGRVILVVVFMAGIVIGFTGEWFHTKGHPLMLLKVPTIWSPTQAKANERFFKQRRPQLAPFSFAALGLLGVLACCWKVPVTVPNTKRFSHRSVPEGQ